MKPVDTFIKYPYYKTWTNFDDFAHNYKTKYPKMDTMFYEEPHREPICTCDSCKLKREYETHKYKYDHTKIDYSPIEHQESVVNNLINELNYYKLKHTNTTKGQHTINRLACNLITEERILKYLKMMIKS